MTDKPESPTPRHRYLRRESAVQSDLEYVLQRQREMADLAAREERYRPGYKTPVGAPGSDERDRIHLYHVRKHGCTCGRVVTKECPVCGTSICAHCECEKEKE